MEPLSPQQVKLLASSSQKQKLENSFLAHWVLLFPQLPVPARQHRFCERKWAFDFAWPEDKLAVEIMGGSWSLGGHNRALQQAKDYEKLNEAVRLGWRVLLFNTPMCQDMNHVVTVTAEVLCRAE